MQDSLDQAVLATLAYGLVFDSVPTFKQIEKWLLSAHTFSPEDIRGRAQRWYQRLGISSSSVSGARSLELIDQIQRVQQVVSWVPWIQAVWVTGSFAAGAIKEDDDLDVLVVTSPHRLWLTRLVVVAISLGLGRYRPRFAPNSAQTRNRWCWNLWLETSAVGNFTPSVYLAREIVQARLIFRRSGVSPTLLLDSSPWVAQYSAMGGQTARRQSSQAAIGEAHSPSERSKKIWDRLNKLAYAFQRRHMAPHHTSERVTFDQAWFHPDDWSQRVQTRYETILAHLHTMTDVISTFPWPEDWTAAERAQLARVAVATREEPGRVVLATGVFDLFHAEHQNFLTKAAEAGEKLVVGVESDARTRLSKGPGRPRQSQQQRLDQVGRHLGVSEAFLLPEAFSRPEHHRALLELLQPDILAVSSHSPHQEKKAALMQEAGGKLVVVHQYNPAVSTTQLLKGTIQE